MTIGEKNIIGATLNSLHNYGLISVKALNKAFENLELSQVHKGICGDNVFYFTGEPCEHEEDIQNENLKPCPFCHTNNLSVSAFWVFCHNCDATGPVGDSRLEGRELWNRILLEDKVVAEA